MPDNKESQTTLDLFYIEEKEFNGKYDIIVNQYNKSIEIYIELLNFVNDKTKLYTIAKKNIENLIVSRNNYIVEKTIINQENKLKYHNINIIYLKSQNNQDNDMNNSNEKTKREYIQLAYEYNEKENTLNVKNIFIVRKFSSEKKQIKTESKIKKILELKIDEIETHLKFLISNTEFIEIFTGLLEILSVPDVIEYFKEQLQLTKLERMNYLLENNISII
jgi:hypothetical protein